MKESTPNPLASVRLASEFLQSYWQQRAGVIAAALNAKELKHQLRPAQVLRLAGNDMTESRLIQHRASRWRVQDGPFQRQDLPTLQRRNWTILVQGVDLHLDAGRALLDRFRFIPDAHLDDLMISVAGPGGGVGPHVDDYDVFLLQLSGQRRWEIAPPGDFRFRTDQPLKLLANFQPSSSVILNPGDMLYLPAKWAHHGIALGPCMTASIGFRAPARSQLQSAWLQDMADQVLMGADHADPRYRQAAPDPTSVRQWRQAPARIPTDMMSNLCTWLRQWQPTDRQIRDFIGRYLTEPQAHIWFDRPDRHATPSALCKHGVVLNKKTRMLWFGQIIFINGESIPLSRDAMPVMRLLANQRRLDAAQATQLLSNDTLKSLTIEWHAAGWLQANNP